MHRAASVAVLLATVSCGGSGLSVPAPVPERAGCYVLGAEAAVAPFSFPDSLELAAEWFLPDDSTGGRLRVIRPRDGSLGTYRLFGGRFWWASTGDSIVVTRSDGPAGAVLTMPADTVEFTGVIRTFGSGASLMERVSGRRVACPEPHNRSTAQPPDTVEGRS